MRLRIHASVLAPVRVPIRAPIRDAGAEEAVAGVLRSAIQHSVGVLNVVERPKEMSRFLGPGERFRVQMPFHLRGGARPAGLLIHHGVGPGMRVIGDDGSFLHQPALAELAVLSG